jgi:RND family efflux transporter MFP subunit
MRHKIARFFLLLTLFNSTSVLAGGMPPAIVQVEDAVNIEIAPFIWISGTVIGRFDSKVAAEVPGNLESVLEVGDRVEKGDIIAKIDDSKYRLVFNEIHAEIKPIETMVEFYRKESERLEKLAKQNNAARNQLDQTQANHDEAQAKIKVVRAKLASANDDLNKTTVHAPFSGVITERFKSNGERVDAGDQIVRLINMDDVEIQTRIPQESFQYIKAGDVLSVKGSSSEATGIVRAVIPVGDDISRLYELRIKFDKQDWLAGTAVQVASPVNKTQKVIAVPRDALVIRQSGIVVYRVNSENIAELVPVTTGIANTTHIQVIGNINENDKIVVRGNERLRPGQPVQLMGTNQ